MWYSICLKIVIFLFMNYIDNFYYQKFITWFDFVMKSCCLKNLSYFMYSYKFIYILKLWIQFSNFLLLILIFFFSQNTDMCQHMLSVIDLDDHMIMITWSHMICCVCDQSIYQLYTWSDNLFSHKLICDESTHQYIYCNKENAHFWIWASY